MTSALLIHSDTHVVEMCYRDMAFPGDVPEGFYVVDVEGAPPSCEMIRDPQTGTFKTPEPPPLTKEQLLAYAAQTRWQHEVGGMTVGGTPIATDDRSKLLINGARAMADQDDTYTTLWFGADGQAYTLDAEAIRAMSTAVARYVSDLFAAFGQVQAAILAGAITDKAAIDAAFGAVDPAR